MSYTVLARRFRSQRFDDVVGQSSIARTLKNAIETGRVARAYLFSGTRGVGKTTMARVLAKSLNCLESEGPTTEPCLRCDSCISVNMGEDIDVIETDGASNTGVDNIRELRQNAIYRPARARYKIYIIDEVHMLSTGAFNALLKILEEPPEHVKFIFATTEPNKVLATIQSRCQRFDFVNISGSDIGGQLKKVLKIEKIKFEDDLVLSLGRLANGSMRDALSLLDQLISTGVQPLSVELLEEYLGQPNSEKVYNLVERISDNDAAGTLEAVADLLETGSTAVQIIDSLVEAVRDIMVLKAAKGKSELVMLTTAERKRLTPLCDRFDISSLVYNVTVLERLRYPIKNSDNPRALLEASLLRLALSEHFMNVSDLISQLGRGGGGRVKKKSIAPKPAPASDIAETENVDRPGIEADAGIDKIKENWPEILAYLKAKSANRHAEMLGKSVPVEFRGNRLVLNFAKSAAFARDLCQSNGRSEQIASLLSEALGREVNVAFELADEQGSVKTKLPRGAKTSQQQINAAASRPAVKAVLLGLDANIIDISETET